MKSKILSILLVIGIIFLLVSCKQDEEVNTLLPLDDGESITFEFSNLIYQNSRSTNYSLGGAGSSFTFNKDTLVVNDNGDIKSYEISYDEIPLTVEGFKTQFYGNDEIPDISSYKNVLQYNLCKATDDSPGYRLYILDDQYWIATLYKNYVWRIVSVDISKTGGQYR